MQQQASGHRPGKRLRSDPQLREELAYCVPLGIPHSTFLSWDDEDQDKALAFTRDANRTCKQCGTQPEDWVDDAFALVANPVRCKGCEVIELEREQIPEGEKGIYVGLIPRQLAEEEMSLASEVDDEEEVGGGLL